MKTFQDYKVSAAYWIERQADINRQQLRRRAIKKPPGKAQLHCPEGKMIIRWKRNKNGGVDILLS